MLPQQQQPQVVHMTRALEPVEMPLTPEVKQKHQDSIELYPHLNLSEHEYVISAVRRHPIGLVGTVIVTLLGIPDSSIPTIGTKFKEISASFRLTDWSHALPDRAAWLKMAGEVLPLAFGIALLVGIAWNLVLIGLRSRRARGTS